MSAQTSDIWADKPVEPPPPRNEPAPPYWWDHAPDGSAVALRKPDGRVLLLLVAGGQSWGVYQLQRFGYATYIRDSASTWELIQIRATKAEARDCAVEMAERCGLLS